MKMKESVLKVTIFCGWITQVTKKGEVSVCTKKNIFLLQKDDLCTLKECLFTEIMAGKKSCFFGVYIYHHVKLKKNFRSFVLI